MKNTTIDPSRLYTEEDKEQNVKYFYSHPDRGSIEVPEVFYFKHMDKWMEKQMR